MVYGTCVCVCVCARIRSVELQKPAAGQPTVRQVLDMVLKECKKESLVYKMAALRSAANILEAAKEDRFQEMADILFPIIRKVKYLQSLDGFWEHIVCV